MRMRVRVLGAHQGEDRSTRFVGLLVDGWLALDAGALTSTLSFEEQLAIRAVFVSHCHWDHIKDLPTLAYNFLNAGRRLTVLCQGETFQKVREVFFVAGIWPDLTERPAGAPTLIHRQVEPGDEIELEGYRLAFFASCHKVPTLGLCLEHEGRRMVYTSDTAPGCAERWVSFEPHLVVTELTLPDRLEGAAAQALHLTPAGLAGELTERVLLRLPEVAVALVHRNPFFEGELVEAIRAMRARHAARLLALNEGDELEV